MKRLIFLLIIIWSSVQSTYSQYMYGTTGMLQMPTAEMQRDKTFMFGASAISPETIPSQEWWGNYYTLNYYINITIFPWLEIGYDCMLVKAKPGIYHWVPSTYGKFVNQDRSFHGRLRIWKEGWWKKWTPQIVVGLNDPTSGSWEGGSSSNDQRYNGFFCRYYVAATKHLDFNNIGSLGVHGAYVWNEKEVHHFNGPCLGANYRFDLPRTNFWNKAANGFNLMAEYDSETINAGFEYEFMDAISPKLAKKFEVNAVVEMNECKYIGGGLLFKVHLK